MASKSEILSKTRRILELNAKKELSLEERNWIRDQAVDGFREHINPAFLKFRKAMSTDYAAVEWEDSGATFKDVYGREFVDCLGGYGIYNLGHRHPRVVQAVKNQLERQALHSQELLDPWRALLADVLADVTPGDLQYSFFGNSGTEAVEGALKLARLHTGRQGFIATVGAFHGKSLGSLSATAKAVFRKPFRPLIPGFHHVPFGNADAVEMVLEASQRVGDEIAAVIVEPIQGEGGVNVPPDGYLRRLRELCDAYGALLIVDEVQTGMGRTGTMWACEREGVVPDIMCAAKALGGGVMPIGAFIARPHVWEKMTVDPFLHTTTFGGNPLSCIAAVAAIHVTLEENLPQRAAETGEYFLGHLKRLMAEHPAICVEARGRGLLLGMEFVSNEVGYEVAKGLFANGVLVGGTLINAKVIRIEPPLTISREQVDYVLNALDRVLDEVDAAFRNRKIAAS